jgi:hypothetical protein
VTCEWAGGANRRLRRAKGIQVIVLRYFRLVLWSFFGVGRPLATREEFAKVRPVPLLATAVTLAILLVGLLIWIASLAAETLER